MKWPLVKLDSLFEIARGGSPRPISEFITDEPDGLNWISIKDASNSGKYITETKQKIKQEGLVKSRMVFPGDFLLTNSMSFGRPYIMGTTGCIHDGWLVLSGNKKKIDQDYFYHLLGSDLLHSKFARLAAGAVVKNLNINLVKGIEIPLPPLAEQKKIAGILDAADRLRQKDQLLIDQYTTLGQSLFREMFGDPVGNPKGWDIQPFEFFATIDTNMTTDFEKYADVPHIGVANIEKNTGRLVNYNPVSVDGLSSGKYIFSKEHIIYSKIRPLLNKVALPDFSGLASADSYPILVRDEYASKMFFAYLLRSKMFLNFIAKHSSRTNIPKANKSQLLQFQAIAPPLDLQKQFSCHVELIDQQKQKAQFCLAKSEALFNSLVQRAFKGELTSTKAA